MSKSQIQQHPAFDYLREEMQRFNQSLPPEKQPSGKKFEANFSKSKDKLEFYLKNADAIQEKLIEATAKISINTIITEALLMRLDQNDEIINLDILKIIVESTLDEISGGLKKNAQQDEIINLVNDDLLALVKDSVAKKDFDSSYKIRTALTEIIAKHPFEIETLSNSDISHFKEARKFQTEALNKYQGQLMAIRKGLIEAKNSGLLQKSSIHSLNPLYQKISTRIDEVEEFRNGLTQTLKPQSLKLGSYSINRGIYNVLKQSTNDSINVVTDLIKANNSDDKSDTVFSIEDVPPSYCDFGLTDHRTLQKLGIYHDRLNSIVTNPTLTKNQNYRIDEPHLSVKENGIKSWKRSIEKVVRKYDNDWDQMGDLSRINVIFKNNHTEHTYNQFTHKLAKDLDWEIQKDHRLKDKGLRTVDTGTTNWNINLKYKGNDPKGLYGEIKLDDYATYVVEKFTHPLYAVTRLLQNGAREIVGDEVNEFQQEQAMIDAAETVRRLYENTGSLFQISKNLGAIVEKQLLALKIQSEEKYSPTFVKDFTANLMKAQQVISFAASRHLDSPSQAAMKASEMEDWLSKQQKACDDLKSQITKNLTHEEFHYKMSKLSKMQNFIENTKARFEEFGPKKTENTTHKQLGHYTQQDLDNFELLQADWKSLTKAQNKGQSK